MDGEFRIDAKTAFDADEVALSRLLYHCHDLGPEVAAILGRLAPADPRLEALAGAVLLVNSKGALYERLVRANVAGQDARILAAMVCDEPELVDHPSRAGALAHVVALRRAESAVLRAGAAGDFAACAAAMAARTALLEAATAVALPVLDLAALDGQPVPSVAWLVTGLLEMANVSLLSGHGGSGKSRLLLHLAGATVLRRGWLNHLVDHHGPALILHCEDDAPELHRRTDAVARHYQVSLTELQREGLRVLPFAGRNAVMADADRNGVLRETPLFRRVRDVARDLRPALIGLDNAADVYSADENVRRNVRAFITMIRGLAIEIGSHVMLTLHPSLTGMSSGSGLSGNTAWHNSVRARLYLKSADDKGDDGLEADPDLRVLINLKNQSNAMLGETTLRYRDGLFLPVHGPSGLDKAAAEMKADDLFLLLLTRLADQGRNVSHTNSKSFAPTVFAAEPDARGVTSKGFAAAMARLFAAGRIHVEAVGPQSRRVHYLRPGSGTVE